MILIRWSAPRVLLLRTRPASFDRRRNSTPRPKIPFDYGPDRIAGLHQVVQYLVHHVLLKDPKIAVAEEILLERFQLRTAFARHIAKGQKSKIWKASFRADRGEFRVVDQNLIAGELIRPGFNRGKGKVE